MKLRDKEGIGRGMIDSNVPEVTWSDSEMSRETSLRIPSVSVWSQTSLIKYGSQQMTGCYKIPIKNPRVHVTANVTGRGLESPSSTY